MILPVTSHGESSQARRQAEACRTLMSLRFYRPSDHRAKATVLMRSLREDKNLNLSGSFIGQQLFDDCGGGENSSFFKWPPDDLHSDRQPGPRSTYWNGH